MNSSERMVYTSLKSVMSLACLTDENDMIRAVVSDALASYGPELGLSTEELQEKVKQWDAELGERIEEVMSWPTLV